MQLPSILVSLCLQEYKLLVCYVGIIRMDRATPPTGNSRWYTCHDDIYCFILYFTCVVEHSFCTRRTFWWLHGCLVWKCSRYIIQTVHWSHSATNSLSLDGTWRDQLAQTLASIRITLSQVCLFVWKGKEWTVLTCSVGQLWRYKRGCGNCYCRQNWRFTSPATVRDWGNWTLY